VTSDDGTCSDSGCHGAGSLFPYRRVGGVAAAHPLRDNATPRCLKAGRRWIIEGTYWISYSLTTPPVISGVFYAMADIPNRL
jgi:hypothetical protein